MTDLVAITADLRIKALGLAKPIEALADPNAMHQQQAILILFIELFTILISAGIFHAINRYNSITTEVSYSDLFENPDDYQVRENSIDSDQIKAAKISQFSQSPVL